LLTHVKKLALALPVSQLHAGPKDYYKLESALFAVQQRHLGQVPYLTAAKSANLEPISMIDKRVSERRWEGRLRMVK